MARRSVPIAGSATLMMKKESIGRKAPKSRVVSATGPRGDLAGAPVGGAEVCVMVTSLRRFLSG